MSTKKPESDPQGSEDYIQPIGALPSGLDPEERAFMSLVEEKRVRMRQSLALQEKVTRWYPASEKDNRPIPVQLNGVKFLVPRGKQVELPVQVAEIIDSSDSFFEDYQTYSDRVGAMNQNE